MKKTLESIALIFVLVTAAGGGRAGEKPTCSLPVWLPMAKGSCSYDTHCRWVRCEDSSSGSSTSEGGLALSACSFPPSLTLWLHAPSLHLPYLNVTLRDGEHANFTSQLFPASETDSTFRFFLAAQLRPPLSSNEGVLQPDLKVLKCPGDTEYGPKCMVVGTFSMPPVPLEVCQACHMEDPFACGAGFTCKQTEAEEKEPLGRCLCIADGGLCPPLVLGESSRGQEDAESDKGSGGGASAIAGGVVGGLILTFLLAGAVFGVIYVRRNGLPKCLRRNDVLTDVPIGGPDDEDDDDDSPIS